MATQVDLVIERFGGLTKMSKALGHEHPTTVQGWRERGVIPSRQMGSVLKAARERGIELSAADLIDDEAA